MAGSRERTKEGKKGEFDLGGVQKKWKATCLQCTSNHYDNWKRLKKKRGTEQNRPKQWILKDVSSIDDNGKR